MTANNKIFKKSEIFFLAATLPTVKLFTNLPAFFTAPSGSGAPLSAALSGILIIAAVFFLSKFLRPIFKNTSAHSLSVIATYIIFSIFLAGLAVSTVSVFDDLSEFARLIAFPDSPLWFVALFFIVAAFFGACSGQKTLLSVCPFIFLSVFPVLALIVVSTLFRSDFLNALPIFGTNLQSTFFSILQGLCMYTDIFLVFLLVILSDRSEDYTSALTSGTTLSAIIIFLVTLSYTAKIPYPLSASEKFPLYILSKEVYFGRFFQRMDALLLLASGLSGMFYLSVMLYLSTEILNKIFGIKERKVTLFPLGITLFSLVCIISSRSFFSSVRSTAICCFLLAISAIASIFLLKKGALFKNEK